jgi:hypothetical protein
VLEPVWPGRPAEDRPALDLVTFQVEAAQGAFGQIHRAAGVALVLAQKQEIFPELVLREGRRITLEVFGQLAHVTHVLLFRRRPVVFEFDKLLELGDRRIVNFHRGRRMPTDEGADKTQ